MSLSKDDRDWVKLIGREIAFEVNKEIVKEHIRYCPHGNKITNIKWLMYGLGMGLIAVNFDSLLGMVKWFVRL